MFCILYAFNRLKSLAILMFLFNVPLFIQAAHLCDATASTELDTDNNKTAAAGHLILKRAIVLGINNNIGGTGTGRLNDATGFDNNLPPYFTQTSYAFTLANCVTNAYVGTIQAQDPNGDTVQYSLIGNPSNLFTLNPTSGQLTYSSYGNPGSATQQTLQAQASDLRGGTDTVQITVTLQCNGGGGGGGYNQPPRFSQTLYTFTVSQCAYNSYVGSVVATDPDGDPIQYSLTGNTNGNFAVDRSNGQITVATNSLSTLGTSFATLQIQARDLRSGFATATVYLTIQCNNISPPITRPLYFGQSFYSFTLSSCTANAYVGSVNAISVGGTAQIQYSLQQPGQFSTGAFAINSNTGQITLVAPFSVQSGSTTTLRIVASDGLGRTAQTTATVYSSCSASGGGGGGGFYPNPSPSFTNNRQPYFAQSYYTFYDTSCAPNAYIGTVRAQDPDNDNIQYSIVYNGGSGYYSGIYTINSFTGTITASSSRASSSPSSSVSFQVLANDLRGRSAVAIVSIQAQCFSPFGSGQPQSYGFSYGR